MVSFQAPFLELNQTTTTTTKVSETEAASKKRKWHPCEADQGILPFKNCKNPKDDATNFTAAGGPKSLSFIQLHLETPLPSEWQRCLDIQSGEIHFYNTRTQKRTLRDPRTSLRAEPSSPSSNCHMSLDLELNLPCGSLNSNSSSSISEKSTSPKEKAKKGSFNSPPPLSTDLFMGLGIVTENDNNKDDEPEQAVEMVATACMKCHMLVMLCKSSPTCPNCKFMHPPYQSTPNLFKSRLNLSY